MKKIIAIVMFAAMIIMLAIPVAALDITVNKGTPAIDGVREDFYVGPFSIANRSNTANGEDEPAGATGEVWLAWDETALYVYTVVSDKTPNYEGSDMHQADSAECFIDWKNAKGAGLGGPMNDDGTYDDVGTEEGYPFWQVRWPRSTEKGDYTTLGGANWFDMGWGGVEWGGGGEFDNFTWVVIDTADGYTCEIKIEAPGLTLAEGQKIPFDLQINDNQEGNERTSMVWMTGFYGNGQQWATPQACGVLLTLGAAPAAPVVPDEPVVDDNGDGGDEVVAPPVVNPPSAQTGDSGIMLVVLAVVLAGAVVFAKRARNRA